MSTDETRTALGQPNPPSTAFPFIVGRGRSGTTLLRAMLDSHPQVAVPPESHFLVPMAMHRRRFERPSGFATERFLTELGTRYGFRRWGLDSAVVRDRLERVKPRDLPEAIRGVFDAYAASHGKARYAEKTPINVVHVDLLARMFPEARFVHLIRDGRDVALSYVATDFGVDTIGEAAIYWRRFVRAGRSAGERLGPSRYREIRYEWLIADQEHVLRSLCGFIDVPFDPAMLSYHTRAEELLGTVSHREHHARLALPPTAGLRDWRRDMGVGDLALFEALASDLLEELGYGTAVDRITLADRMRATKAHLRVLAGQATARVRRPARRMRRRFTGPADNATTAKATVQPGG